MPKTNQLLRICLVAHYAYGMMTGRPQGQVGGVERQTSLMARWLAARGHRVSILTWDEGQDEIVEIDGVRVIKMCKLNAGLPGLRFFYPKWTSLNKAMKTADAHLYYHNCAEYVTGQVAMWCRLHGRKFIYSVASDAECDPKLPALRTLRERLLFRYGLRKADSIIVQTRTQQKKLQQGFNLVSEVLPMPSPVPHTDNYQPRKKFDSTKKPRILWVGRIDREKRLELMLDIARLLPEVDVDVVGKPTRPDEPYARELLERARSFVNVILHGMVPHSQIDSFYDRADIICCTSLYEGFPNTFIEAWSRGLPVVTTFEPDEIVSTHKLGIYAEDSSGLAKGITILLNDRALWQEMSSNAHSYYLDNHMIDRAMARFEAHFQKTLAEKSYKDITDK